MTKIIVCKFCKQKKQHKAHGLCKNCYQKHLSNKEDICNYCGEIKKKYRQNPPVCYKCYQKNNKNSVCSKCGSNCVLYIKEPPLCKKCYVPPKITCKLCGKEKPHKAKKLCFNCYQKQHQGEMCKICGKSSIKAKSMCNKCYHKDRSKNEICSVCKIRKKISKWEDGQPVCPQCNRKIGKCIKCNKIKPLCSIKRKICRQCYSPPYQKCDICGQTNEIAKIKENKKVCRKCYHKLPERCGKYVRNGGVSDDIWLQIMNKFDWRCFYCNVRLNRKNRTVDHIIPIKIGGSNNVLNLIACCRHCNSSKNDREVFLWLENDNIILNKEKIQILIEAKNGHIT